MENLLRLNLELVRTLVAGRSLTQSLAQWPAVKRPNGDRIPPPDKATISRWLNGVTFPRSRDELFGLAGALGVDPLAILSLTEDTSWGELCDAVRSYNLGPQLAPAVKRYWFLRDLILPSREWPSPEIARKYFGRDWRRYEREHRTAVRRNYYSAFVLDVSPAAPLQVWHFAWRKETAMSWRPYGFVRLEDSAIRICCFDGSEASVARGAGGRFAVETWFGRCDADFRVASLDSVTCTEGVDAKAGAAPVVRFRKSRSQ